MFVVGNCLKERRDRRNSELEKFDCFHFCFETGTLNAAAICCIQWYSRISYGCGIRSSRTYWTYQLLGRSLNGDHRDSHH